ncbi:N-acetyltransferase [Ktedonosporobacter rubrisoli]|uniref:N-acetyltransferase n=1 Tax=Ktedonosporobacter rubrisoli TaxID=2509675 RepID=A0A4P6JJZ2_KTERU|nr:GNAT family N-acetyltransferase [Ktedonosporobacter rubrisoli]QBD75363.1 N-acetyltransferase [Ktedonosporobacter rubrisoli]
MIVCETERLLVRYLRDEDFEDFYAICSDPVVTRYVGEGTPLSAEQTRQWLQISKENYRIRGYGCFAIIQRKDCQFIGFGGIARPSDKEQVEIIYAFKQPCWGQGLATEFARALLISCFERWKFPRIEATIYPQNQASARVLEKAGMQFVHTFIDEDGQPVSLYALDNPVRAAS